MFKGFDEDEHVGDYPRQPSWALYAASDAGFTNPSVFLLIQVDPFGERIEVLDEVYQEGLTAEEFALLIQERFGTLQGVIKMYPDPADPAFAKTLSEKLKIPLGKGTGGELKWRLDAIRAALKERNTHLPVGAPERHPRLVFDRKCERTISDMLNYRYPERRSQTIDVNAPENPMKKDDHGPEALGRFFAGHFGTAGNRRKARNRKSSMAA